MEEFKNYLISLFSDLVNPYRYEKVQGLVLPVNTLEFREKDNESHSITLKLVVIGKEDIMLYVKSSIYPKILTQRISSQKQFTKKEISNALSITFLNNLFPPIHEIPSLVHLSTPIILNITNFNEILSVMRLFRVNKLMRNLFISNRANIFKYYLLRDFDVQSSESVDCLELYRRKYEGRKQKYRSVFPAPVSLPDYFVPNGEISQYPTGLWLPPQPPF
mmetsp:Transcript_7654/g.8352  ORF Transcript_7654/g.8352 Transcript_7654/m.8352 type:complete len:219 (+) Transcript_7654:57-713(+)|eukprot:gene7950-8592_t